MVEQDWEVSLGADFPWGLRVILDLIEEDGTIVDNKFFAKTPSCDSADSDIQLTTYALGYRLQTGKIEKGLHIDAMIKLKTPKYVRLETTRSNADLRWHLKMVEELGQQIHSGLLPPNPTGWWCSPKWCGYYEKCKGGQHKEDA